MKYKIFKNYYDIFLFFVTLLALLPILAPILMHFNLEVIAKPIYFIYSFTCHQFDSRSLHLFDYQYAWCARDTAIWFSFALTSWYIRFQNIKPLKFYWIIPFIIPIAFDGGIQTIYTILDVAPTGVNAGEPLYISNNFARFFTGAIFGVGLALLISTSIKNTIIDLKKESFLKVIKAKEVVFLLCFIVLVYTFLVRLWMYSSELYKPYGSLDLVVRTPEKNFFLRRGHAVCPVNPVDYSYTSVNSNFLYLDCFF